MLVKDLKVGELYRDYDYIHLLVSICDSWIDGDLEYKMQCLTNGRSYRLSWKIDQKVNLERLSND